MALQGCKYSLLGPFQKKSVTPYCERLEGPLICWGTQFRVLNLETGFPTWQIQSPPSSKVPGS